MNKAFLSLLLAALLLVGCTAENVRDDLSTAQVLWQERQQALLQIGQWAIKGRIGVITPEQGWHASMHWQQQDDAYEIGLAGPLNQGVMRIYGDDSGISLVIPDKGVVHAPSADALFKDKLGWSLPVEAIRYWARGLPAAKLSVEKKLDEKGRITELRQAGWHVLFPRYVREGGFQLPGKLVIERTDLKIKLILSNWTLSEDL